jgi:type II secretory pathway predicted ATPase ExeA
LTNAEMDSQSPFAGVLLGQPSLRKRLRLGSFAALDQRIALRYELPGMSEQESGEYSRHHIELAGRKDNLFSDDALELLHRSSRGIPRQLNNLATQALIACYASQKATVDLSCAQAAVAEVQAE